MTKISFIPRLISFCVLIVLIVLHVMPVPILEVLILYVVLNRPRWFKKIVDKVYSDEVIPKNMCPFGSGTTQM